MKLGWLAVVVLALTAGLCFGCSRGLDSAPSRPDLDTLRAALSERDDLERKYLLTSFLRVMAPEDMPAVLMEVEKHRVGITSDDVRLLMLAWTRFDAPGAFATARDWPTPWKAVLMEQAMHAWGFSDGRTAIAECGRIEDEALRERLRQAVVSGWLASRDRLGAAEYAATVSNGRQRNRLAFRLVGETMRDGPDAVIAFAAAVPADAPQDFKQIVFIHAAGALARVDPERVAPWYAREMKQPYAAMALRTIANKWARHHDPQDFIDWIETLPMGESLEEERADGIRAAFRIWVADAPAEAEAWLESASPSPGRDKSIDEFARATVGASPGKALGWVTEIADEQQRLMSTLRYTRQWFVQDPEAAQTWIAGADVPDDWRQQILRNLPGRTGLPRKKNAEADG